MKLVVLGMEDLDTQEQTVCRAFRYGAIDDDAQQQHSASPPSCSFATPHPTP